MSSAVGADQDDLCGGGFDGGGLGFSVDDRTPDSDDQGGDEDG